MGESNTDDLIREIELPISEDERGKLIAIENAPGMIPFDPARIFFISNVPVDAERANHAVDCPLFLTALTGGAVLTEYVDGRSESWRLRPVKGLLIPAMRFIRIHHFEENTLVAGFAPKRYSETKYFFKEDNSLTTHKIPVPFSNPKLR